MSNQAFNEFFKSGLDFNQILSTQRRNIEAISAVNQAVVESAQEISRRQAEAVRDHVETVLKASKEIFTGGTPETSIAKQADLAKSIFESALSNLREITELATKSSFEAFDVLNKRAAESMEEITKASSAKKSAKA